MRIFYQIMLLCMISMASAFDTNCVIDSWEIISVKSVCPCISSYYQEMVEELKLKKENLSLINKELELTSKHLEVFSNEFVTIECVINDESPLLCTIRDLQVPNEKVKVVGSKIDENSYYEPEDMTELEILNSNTKFIPSEIFVVMSGLESFTVIESALGEITRGSFKGADKIDSITIEGNDIPYLGPNIFEGAETVLHLLLSENRIFTVSPDAFNGLVNLKVLSLRGNNLKEIHPEVFTDNILLRKLEVSHNRVQKVDADLLINNPELIVLKLNDNKITIEDFVASGNHSKLLKNMKEEVFVDFNQTKISINETKGLPEENDDGDNAPILLNNGTTGLASNSSKQDSDDESEEHPTYRIPEYDEGELSEPDPE